MGRAGEGGGGSNGSRGVGEVQGASQGTQHTGEVRRRVSSVGRSWRVENSQAAVLGGDIASTAKAGQHRPQRSIFWRQEPYGGACALLLPRERLLRPHGYERTHPGLLRGTHKASLPGHLRGSRDERGIRHLPHALVAL